tara:strand:+ start:28 stop:582 length:555 start_codon:yes stop_codon:yes gene_type:complete
MEKNLVSKSIIILFFILSYYIFPLKAQIIGSETGFKIPRFISLKSNDANLRLGSSKNYPIILKYTSKDLPLEILDEYEDWRRIIDINGNEGWMHKNLLKGDRSAIINTDTANVYNKPHGYTVGQIGRNNIVQLKKCLIDWCLIKKNKNHGWILKKNLWGVYQDETINIPKYQFVINLFWKIGFK